MWTKKTFYAGQIELNGNGWLEQVLREYFSVQLNFVTVNALVRLYYYSLSNFLSLFSRNIRTHGKPMVSNYVASDNGMLLRHTCQFSPKCTCTRGQSTRQMRSQSRPPVSGQSICLIRTRLQYLWNRFRKIIATCWFACHSCWDRCIRRLAQSISMESRINVNVHLISVWLWNWVECGRRGSDRWSKREKITLGRVKGPKKAHEDNLLYNWNMRNIENGRSCYCACHHIRCERVCAAQPPTEAVASFARWLATLTSNAGWRRRQQETGCGPMGWTVQTRNTVNWSDRYWMDDSD